MCIRDRNERYGFEVSSTFVIDYPSIDMMVGSIVETMNIDAEMEVSHSVKEVQTTRFFDDVDFIQALCAFGEFRDIREAESVGTVPFERWDHSHLDSLHDNLSDVPVRFAAYLHGVGNFDPSAFRMFRPEAMLMDPQQRLLLEETLSLKQQTSFERDGVGCYIACCSLDYTRMPSVQSIPIGTYSFTSAALSVVSGRTSFCFGLRGPSLTVDVACASSLVTTHLGLRYTRENKRNSAVCGGAMISFVPTSTLSLQNAGFLSDDGRCKSFDAAADGYGRGEACRLAYISNVEGEESSTRNIVLSSSAVNHSGFSSSLTAPNGPAQEDVIQQSISMSNSELSAIHMLQTHCIGTALGDPIELKACFTSVKSLHSEIGQISNVAVSSRKGATGHQEAAAGIMLLHNAVKSLQSNTVPGINNLRGVNPYIADQISGIPSVSLALPRTRQMLAYQERGGNVACVNSFAAQGTNSNILMKCYGDSNIRKHSPMFWNKENLWLPLVCPKKIKQVLFTSSDPSLKYSKAVFDIPLNSVVSSRAAEMCVTQRCILPSGVILDAIDSATQALTRNASVISNFVISKYYVVSQSFELHDARMIVTLEADGEVSLDVQEEGEDPSAPYEISRQYKVSALMSRLEEQARPDESITKEYTGRLSGTFPVITACYECEDQDDTWFIDSLNPRNILPYKRSYGDLPHVLTTIKSFMIGKEAQAMKQVVAFENVDGGFDLVVNDRNTQKQVLVFDNIMYEERSISHARKVSQYSDVSELTMQTYKEVDFVRVSSDSSTDDEELSPLYKEKYPEDFEHYKPPKGENLENFVNSGYEEVLALVKTEVQALIGHTPQDDEPLMSNGMDSRNAMELRSSLNNAIGMKLPATLLYDYQTVESIAKFTAAAIEKTKEEQGGDIDSDASAPDVAKVKDVKVDSKTPSIKTLRGNVIRPLFLAAPGVANGQSAYFAFMRFLGWCDQPIYTLEKDNEISIHELAKNHVRDMIEIQPYGPYLIGGHSYGGVVALEVAIQLQNMGREIAGVFLFDAPHPCQIRKAEADAIANDKNAVELMEMILNAIDFGHQRQGWANMPFYQKYEYFAPVYRIMRDENFSAVQVREQVLAIASAIKTGSQPSDMRSHVFSGYLEGADVYYFRANIRGVVAYMHDEDFDDEEFPHGVGWMDFCSNLKIIDVPGDHFTMLRQPLGDMRMISEPMKQVLVGNGWQELKKEKEVFSLTKEEAEEMEAYLQKMGLRKEDTEALKAKAGLWFVGNEAEDPNNPNAPAGGLAILDRVKNHEFDYDIDDVRDDDIRTGLVAQFHVALNAKGTDRELTSDDVKIARLNDVGYKVGDLCCFFFHDVTGYVDLLDDLVSCMSIQCFGLQLPDFECLHGVRSIEELVEVYVQAIRVIQPKAPYLLVGFGMGCQLAYEAAVQMGPEQVASVLFIDGQVTKDRGYHQDAIWYGLYTLISQDISVDKFVKEMQRRRRFEDQLQYMLRFCPDDVDPLQWDQTVNEQLCKTHFCAMAAEVYDPEKYYNGSAYLFSSLWSPDADSQEIDSRSFMIKLVSKKHRGLDMDHAIESAEKIELAICESLEYWEKMVKDGCEELLAESRTTLREVVTKKDQYEDPPYVHRWIMEELPLSSDLMWGEGSETSGNYDTDVGECFEMEEGSGWGSDFDSGDQPDIQAVKWDEIDRKLAELRNKGRQ